VLVPSGPTLAVCVCTVYSALTNIKFASGESERHMCNMWEYSVKQAEYVLMEVDEHK
jgi:hypothetical protein